MKMIGINSSVYKMCWFFQRLLIVLKIHYYFDYKLMPTITTSNGLMKRNIKLNQFYI